MHLDVYEDLVYEFYNSLSVFIDEHNNIIGYTMRFRMRGEDYEIMIENFVEWLNCDNKGILNTPIDCISDFLWRDFGGIGPYYINMTKSKGFSYPIVKILCQMITYSLYAKKSKSRHVLVQDMVLLKVVIDGRQVDITK